MIFFALIGTGLALLKPQLLWIFFIHGALMGVNFFPTIFSITRKDYTEQQAFWSIVIGLIIALPLSAYANITGNTDLIVWSAIISVFVPVVVSVITDSKAHQDR